MKDDAVAEVVGVILIIAITVVIAAIVAAFAMGMGSSIKKPYTVYFKLDKSGPTGNITITNFGGKDLSYLQNPVEISYTNTAGVQTAFDTPANIIINTGGHAYGTLSNQFASEFELDTSIVQSDGQCHVIVIGNFTGGSQQVIMQGDI